MWGVSGGRESSPSALPGHTLPEVPTACLVALAKQKLVQFIMEGKERVLLILVFFGTDRIILAEGERDGSGKCKK